MRYVRIILLTSVVVSSTALAADWTRFAEGEASGSPNEWPVREAAEQQAARKLEVYGQICRAEGGSPTATEISTVCTATFNFYSCVSGASVSCAF